MNQNGPLPPPARAQLDNLLYSDSLERPGSLKLADWGFATFVGRGPAARRVHGVCGTSFYIAPVGGRLTGV
jgi:hypothetical protein